MDRKHNKFASNRSITKARYLDIQVVLSSLSRLPEAWFNRNNMPRTADACAKNNTRCVQIAQKWRTRYLEDKVVFRPCLAFYCSDVTATSHLALHAHALQPEQISVNSVINERNFTWWPEKFAVCYSPFIGMMQLEYHTSHCPRMRYTGFKFGINWSIINGTLLRELRTFSTVSTSIGVIQLKHHTSQLTSKGYKHNV